jgi:ParB family chromosome partitioning protein
MSVQEIDLKKIRPNRLNPRLEIDIEALNELSDSIRQTGLIEPVIVRAAQDGYEIVVGERRYRAAQQAGLEKIPAVVKDLSDEQVIELNIIENIHRQDLSAVEKGNSCKMLLEKYPKVYPNREKLAKKLGVSIATINAWLQLVNAPLSLQKMIEPAQRSVPRRLGKLDYDTAVSIVKQIKNPDRQVEVAQEIANRPIYRRVARQIIKVTAKAPDKTVKEIIQEFEQTPYELPFRLNHAELIRKGTKTRTTRIGIPDPRIREGSIVHAAIWEPHFAEIEITGITKKKLREFTEEDARKEGGYSLAEFKNVWRDLHGEWSPSEVVYVITFRRVGEK